jgi:hypothetical protein
MLEPKNQVNPHVKDLSPEIKMGVCKCLTHDEKMSKEYKYLDVICQECCKGYCPSCSYHNGHPKQPVDGKIRNCVVSAHCSNSIKDKVVYCEEQQCQKIQKFFSELDLDDEKFFFALLDYSRKKNRKR